MTDPGGPVGPGRLILVAGPSGAGKDTLIDGVRTLCATEHDVVFPRRLVTRVPSTAEQHDHLDDDAFDRAAKRGDFAFWWQAHGLKYAIPRSIDDDIRAGRAVVCNVSRTIVSQARERYANVEAVLITAPTDRLAARLTARSRSSDGAIVERLRRNEELAHFAADHVIENIGPSESGVVALLGIIRQKVAVLGS